MQKVIDKMIDDAKIAQTTLVKISDKELNKIIIFVIKNILNTNLNKKISQMAIDETGFGNVDDKIEKNKNKTINLLNEILPIKTFEPYYQKEKNLFKILKPVGVICGTTPSTNPIATTLNYFINAIKCKNSIIFCPNIRTYQTIFFLINYIKSKLLQKNINPNIISLVPKNLLRDEKLTYLFNSTDKNIVTGNQHIINKVKKSIKPYLVFGTGNAVIIIEKSANIDFAVKSIVESKSFDNSTSCSSDSAVLIDRKIYDATLLKFRDNGLYILNEKQKKKLDSIFFIKGSANPLLIAKSANYILEKLDINKKNAKVIGYETESNDLNHYIFLEKLLPITAIVKVDNPEDSLIIANELINNSGRGHSCGVFSKNNDFIQKVGKKIDVSRVIVNQAHSKSAGGSKNNSLNTTLSLGCGAWGQSNINHNLFYEDFCNITFIVKKKNRKFLSMDKLLSKYG